MLRHVISRAVLLSAGCALLFSCTPKPGNNASNPPASVAGRSIAVIGSQQFTAPTNNVKLASLPQTALLQPKGKDAVTTIKTIRVGLLIPLTGRNATLGRAMQDAATIALYDKYASLPVESDTRVELLPKDTGDSPEQAGEAMTQAIADGAQFVIGPIFSDATEVAAPIAREHHINMLSFSNNLANPGQGIYAFGFSPQDQTRRVMEFALKQGKMHFAALVPNSALGTTVLAAAKDVLAEHQQVFVNTATYAPQGLGIDAAVSQLMPADATQPSFDALLLPEGDASLSTILRTLSAHGITTKNVQFLGTGIWDDASLVRRVPLDGAWLASSPPDATALFENRFRKTFNYAPPRVASLAYDAVSLAVTLATTGRNFDNETLTQHAGFNGPANGMFRLRTNGKTDRGLAVLEISGGFFNVISAPPSVFQAE